MEWSHAITERRQVRARAGRGILEPTLSIQPVSVHPLLLLTPRCCQSGYNPTLLVCYSVKVFSSLPSMAFVAASPPLRCLGRSLRVARGVATAGALAARAPAVASRVLPTTRAFLTGSTSLPLSRAADQSPAAATPQRRRLTTMAGGGEKPVGWSTVLSSPTVAPGAPTPATPESARAAHILVESEAEAAAAWAAIDGGKAFGEVAKASSSCPSSSRGGDLGWFGRGAMVPEFEKAAFEHPVGTVLMVRSGFGWHLVEVTGARAGVSTATVHQLADRLKAAGPPPQLIDVREAGELDSAFVDGFVHVPMSELGSGGGEALATLEAMDKAAETYVMCHHGIRSRTVADALVRGGWENVINVEGGIHAYALEVDSSVGTY